MTLTELSLVAISTHKLSFKNALQAFSQTLWSHGSIEMTTSLWATLSPIAMNIKPIRNSTLVQCICTLPSIEIRKFTSFWRNMNDFDMVSTSYIHNVVMLWITGQKWKRKKFDIFGRKFEHKIPCKWVHNSIGFNFVNNYSDLQRLIHSIDKFCWTCLFIEIWMISKGACSLYL